MKEVLNRIVEARKAIKKSQKEIGENLGISQAAYAKLESGTSITVDRLFKIADILDVQVLDLLNIVDSTSTSRDSNLLAEIDRLKKRIAELEEQLDDKRQIIEFLSNNDLSLPVAAKLYLDQEPKQKFENGYIDSLIKHLDRMPYDPDDKKSQIDYIIHRLNEIKNGNHKK